MGTADATSTSVEQTVVVQTDVLKPYRWFSEVKTMGQGWLQTRGWFSVGWMCAILGGWFLLYELILLNVEDRDARDMMWDLATTLPAIQAHHAHFRTAGWRYLEALSDEAKFESKVAEASHDLPVVVYEYSKSNCVVELRVPCLSTDHRTRPAAAGPLNTGVDEGQWAVGGGRSLLRNSTFQGLVQGVRYRFDSAMQFQANLEANVELIRSVPPAVPPPANLRLNAVLRNTWSLADWSAYVDAVWPQLQTASCARPFDLCPQAQAALPEVVTAAPGVVRVVPYEHSGTERPAPVVYAYRDGVMQPVTFASGSVLTPTTTTVLDLAATGLGYVDPHTIQQFAAAARTTFPPAADYFVPSPPVPLSDAVTVEGIAAPMELTTTSHRAPTKFTMWAGAGELWFWGKHCTGQGTTQFVLDGTASAVARPAFQAGQFPTVTVRALGEARAVPWFRVEADWDAGTASVQPLTRVRVTASMAALRGPEAAWRLHDVVGEYGEAVTGQLTDMLLRAAAVGVDVSMHDVSEPWPERLPEFGGTWRVPIALTAGGVFTLWLLSLPFLMCCIGGQVRHNNGRPPLWYRQHEDYRGW